MARREPLDANAIDRAERLANGEDPDAGVQPGAARDPDPGEAQLEQPIAPEADQRQQRQPAEQPADDPVVEEPPVKVQPAIHNKRAEIVERARAKRIEEAAANEPVDEPAREEPVARAQPQQQPVARKVKVDHVEREVSPEEYERAARLGLAVGNRLDGLTNSLAEIRQHLANQRPVAQVPAERDSPASQPVARQQAPQQRQSPPRQTAAEVTDEELDRLGDLLLYGEPEERRQALRELRSSGGSALTAEAVMEEIEARRHREDELAQAGQKFANDHPAIAKDRGLTMLAVAEMQALAIEEMRVINVPPEYLAQAMSDPEVAFQYHKNLRGQGYGGLSQPLELSNNAARAIAERYRVVDEPAPAPVPGARPNPTGQPLSTQRFTPPANARNDRAASKETMMQQPRRAAMIARTPPAPAARSRGEVISGMRRARGYTTLPT